MSNLVKRLRHHSKHPDDAKQADGEYLHEVFGRAADRIEDKLTRRLQ
jgi:hypothetical protein